MYDMVTWRILKDRDSCFIYILLCPVENMHSLIIPQMVLGIRQALC